MIVVALSTFILVDGVPKGCYLVVEELTLRSLSSPEAMLKKPMSPFQLVIGKG
jgi:hypothetical protein